ncbi:MAG: 6-carboxytetrahydropterin synthase [Bacteroidales bacterium]
MTCLTRREQYSAAHRMFRPELSDEENMIVCGKCSNHLWHTHNYLLMVAVKGEPHTATGYFINATRHKEIMKDRVIVKFDKKNMNLKMDFMTDKAATGKKLAITIWDEPEIPLAEEGATPHCVRMEEGATLHCMRTEEGATLHCVRTEEGATLHCVRMEEGATLYCVRMEETENNYVEYYGELWKNLMTAAESCLTATTR